MSAAVELLRAPATIRERCARVLEAGLAGQLRHFAIDLGRLPAAASFTAQITRERYPDLRVPAHSRMAHFDVGGVARAGQLQRDLEAADARERARSLVDIVVTSVLLDAGAGASWRYLEAGTGLSIGRSEGLAVASLAWVKRGGLSSRGAEYHVDAAGLAAVDVPSLVRAFQVRDDNPLVGVEGRVHLLRALGRALQTRSDVFGSTQRIGGLVDGLWSRARGNSIEAREVLAALLDGLGSIWPGRMSLDDTALGDVWPHAAAGGSGPTAGLVPFHKLSQWLCYSLLAPLEQSGLNVVGLDQLTGLAEYRNGGLFVDFEVLVPKHAAVLRDSHEVGGELVVEWRALTVALLDRIAPLVRAELGLDERALPLPSVLEGGTWAAGRAIAQQKRSDGGPPLRVQSDGTVF